MGGDVITNLLDKLSAKTGREWSLEDILRLAQKLPEINEQNLDNVLDELAEMGVAVSPDAKQKVWDQLGACQDGLPEKLDELADASGDPKQRKAGKNVSPAKMGKRKRDLLLEKVRRMQKKPKKK